MFACLRIACQPTNPSPVVLPSHPQQLANIVKVCSLLPQTLASLPLSSLPPWRAFALAAGAKHCCSTTFQKCNCADTVIPRTRRASLQCPLKTSLKSGAKGKEVRERERHRATGAQVGWMHALQLCCLLQKLKRVARAPEKTENHVDGWWAWQPEGRMGEPTSVASGRHECGRGGPEQKRGEKKGACIKGRKGPAMRGRRG